MSHSAATEPADDDRVAVDVAAHGVADAGDAVATPGILFLGGFASCSHFSALFPDSGSQTC